ncbi:hypothetical protein [uncultured Amaricoccus sp.]|uniref:hypothetical protein n=1 Tax=uncultured Amaricoccus sp. TaxID=339341 RepID=UPI0026045B63|nr:hypothetical protein [uncultured Amaricoccus sp.]
MMLDVVEIGETHENPSFQQYAKQLLLVMKWRGYERPDLSKVTADLKTWLEHAPRYDACNATLLRDLEWKKGTYQQYQKGGRLLIEHVTGAFAERTARKAIDDDTWAMLGRRADALAGAALVSSERLRGLARIKDVSRAAGFQSTDLTNERVVGLKERANSANEWENVKRGAGLLDDLRMFPTLLPVLPERPIGRIEAKWRRPFVVPEQLRAELEIWLKEATTTYPEDVESEVLRQALAEPHSDGARGIFAAALGNYIDVLGTVRDLTAANTLADLFTPEDIIAVLSCWIAASPRPGGLAPGTMFQYFDVIRLTLLRNGQRGPAQRLKATLKNHPVLKQGKAARKKMSAKNQTWCLALINDPRKTETFENQHIFYAERAKATLDEAAAQDFDLVRLANDPDAMRRLSAKKRGRAKKLIGRARRFGTCAAFAAIELEGAPLREDNTLSLTRSGPKQTFFDHASGDQPHYRIVIPNEMLKNGAALTERGEEMPPIIIEKRGPDDVALQVLKFYFTRIRPLFPRARASSAVFPSVESDAPHLNDKTFSNWLLSCSIDIDLSLTSHNFRHGLCSIQINEDPNCIEDLAVFLGDQPETVRKYYAFLKRDAVLSKMQDTIAARRATYRAGRGLARKLAA